jgi:opacity protein-like surface antigen
VYSRKWTIGAEYLWSDVEGDAAGHEVRASLKHRF